MPNENQVYLNAMANLTRHNRRLYELFASIPQMSTEDYQKTAFIYANKRYETELSKDEPIPHGFYQILENSINTNGLLQTFKKYNNEINLIAETLKIEVSELRRLIKYLKTPQTSHLNDEFEYVEARKKLRELLRKFNSVSKENYIKEIVSEKMRLLESTIITINKKSKKNVLTPENFVQYIFNNPLLLKRIRNLIYDKLDLYANNTLLNEIILLTTKNNYIEPMAKLLDIKEPDSWKKYIAERHIRRLENNFYAKLKDMAKNYSEEDKLNLITLIKYEKKCYELDQARDNDTYNNLKMLIKKADMELIQWIAQLLKKSNSDIALINGEITFIYPPRITPLEKQECEQYKQKICGMKSIHNLLYKQYKKQNDLLTDFMWEAKTTIPEEETSKIDKTKWLNVSKMQQLISLIDIESLNKMPNETYQALKNFLLKDGLLWTYIAGNIDIETIKRIINNFASIYPTIDSEKLNINNIQEIVRKANLYDYVDDFDIALIGLDNLSKLINYNQFLGVQVTEDIIKLRIRKARDLAIRAEYKDHSSLPFTCDIIRKDGYSLMRYRNNDPSIFVSGIDTKTCFCIGVNENDFFFYSLLSKDGYVIKIVNQKNELVARASCFRKNNVLMINGIRTINNKFVPENQEELIEFKAIVDLIRLMAKKMIAITSEEKCPIDYVVCNQAGILENAYFESLFEKINSNLFKEPVNIYNDEWQEFVHMYDNCEEQLLQEVCVDSEHSFTTDFGNHYPALLIESRNNMGLVSPRDISLEDEEAIYQRPRNTIKEYIGEEIDSTIISSINRIRALDYNRRQKNNEPLSPFTLITSSEDIKKVCIGNDWCIIINKNDQTLAYYTKINHIILGEASKYIQSLRSKSEKGVKLYVSLEKKPKNNT